MMLTLFLSGLFLGATLGFFLHAIFSCSHDADLAAQCMACEASYQARLRRHQVKLDTNDMEWWECEKPNLKGMA